MKTKPYDLTDYLFTLGVIAFLWVAITGLPL